MIMKLEDRDTYERLLIAFTDADKEVATIEQQLNEAKGKRHSAMHACIDWTTLYAARAAEEAGMRATGQAHSELGYRKPADTTPPIRHSGAVIPDSDCICMECVDARAAHRAANTGRNPSRLVGG